MKLVSAGRRFPGLVSSARNAGKIGAQSGRADLEHLYRSGQIP